VEAALREHLGAAGTGPVAQAVDAALLAPAKRLRPILSLLVADIFRTPHAVVLPAACSIEMVHTASLILDDLPSMDDAPLRRGRRANHLEFGEAIAILAAFGLLNLTYGVLAASYPPALAAQMSTLVSNAVGPSGLIGGQALDLEATDRAMTFETLEKIHRGKTGALFVAAAVCGALTAGAAAEPIAALTAYAKNLGLAFQIVDDLLDVAGTTEETGKAVRADARKTTFVSFSGIDGARQLAAELCDTADRALAPFGGKADRLRELSAFVAARRL
jgi:geranylgeranyl diphosphate synthase type II